MKYLAGFLTALALLVCGAPSFAQDYAIVTIKASPGKKYHATEFGYRKMADDVIVYYAKPQDGRLMQGKDDIMITTKIGTIYFHSDRMVSLDRDRPDAKLDLVCNGTELCVNGNFVVKLKKSGKMLDARYDMIVCKMNGSRIDFESLDGSVSSFSKKDVLITTKRGAVLTFGNNEIVVQKGKYAVSFTYNLASEEAYCFVR